MVISQIILQRISTNIDNIQKDHSTQFEPKNKKITKQVEPKIHPAFKKKENTRPNKRKPRCGAPTDAGQAGTRRGDAGGRVGAAQTLHPDSDESQGPKGLTKGESLWKNKTKQMYCCWCFEKYRFKNRLENLKYGFI